MLFSVVDSSVVFDIVSCLSRLFVVLVGWIILVMILYIGFEFRFGLIWNVVVLVIVFFVVMVVCIGVVLC